MRMGLGLPFLKTLVDLSQYCGTRELFNNRSIVNKSEFDDFISSNYQNNTNIACSVFFVNKIYVTIQCPIF